MKRLSTVKKNYKKKQKKTGNSPRPHHNMLAVTVNYQIRPEEKKNAFKNIPAFSWTFGLFFVEGLSMLFLGCCTYGVLYTPIAPIFLKRLEIYLPTHVSWLRPIDSVVWKYSILHLMIRIKS